MAVEDKFDGQRKVERRMGVLESFRMSPTDNFATVRAGDCLLKLPVSARGILQRDDSIALCSNGERYNKIPEGTVIAFDVMFDARGENPVTGPWAPKQAPPQP